MNELLKSPETITVIVIAIGLAFAFRTLKDDGGPFVVKWTSFCGILLVWLSTITVNGASIAKAASEQGERVDVAFANTMIRIEYAFGFWVVILSLIVSFVFAAQKQGGGSLAFASIAERIARTLAGLVQATSAYLPTANSRRVWPSAATGC